MGRKICIDANKGFSLCYLLFHFLNFSLREKSVPERKKCKFNNSIRTKLNMILFFSILISLIFVVETRFCFCSLPKKRKVARKKERNCSRKGISWACCHQKTMGSIPIGNWRIENNDWLKETQKYFYLESRKEPSNLKSIRRKRIHNTTEKANSHTMNSFVCLLAFETHFSE